MMISLSTVSGLSGSKETAQSQVLIGMGLLAGSTVFLVTLLWGTCVVVGKSDLSEDSTSIDLQDTKGFSLTSKAVVLLRHVNFTVISMTFSLSLSSYFFSE